MKRFRAYMDDAAIREQALGKLRRVGAVISEGRKHLAGEVDRVSCTLLQNRVLTAGGLLSSAAGVAGAAGAGDLEVDELFNKYSEELFNPVRGLEPKFIQTCTRYVVNEREKLKAEAEKAAGREKKLETRRAKEAGERAAKRAAKGEPAPKAPKASKPTAAKACRVEVELSPGCSLVED